MITIKPVINDIKEYQHSELPPEAIKLYTPVSNDEMLKKSAPIAAILCVVLVLTMFAKTIISGTVVIQPLTIAVGFIIGFLLLGIHEWLHAVVYPKEAHVIIGRVKGKFLFVALASYPMIRSRFILMCLLPFLLGIIPLAVFLISPSESRAMNGVMFGMACMGMVSPYPDVYNVITVLKQTKKQDMILFYENDIYRIGK